MRTQPTSLRRTLRLAPLAVAVCTGLAACGGGGGGGVPTGVAQLRLTDAPVCSNISSVVVTITAVELIGTSGAQTLQLSQPVQQDLTRLVNGNQLTLGQITLPAGTYQQVRLILAPNSGATPANYITLGTSTTPVPLTTPSAQQSGLKVNGQFSVAANGQANLTLDFNACRSVVKAGNSGKYLLKPVINLLDDDSSGSITGTLSSSSDAGAVVMAEDAQGHIVRTTVAMTGNGTTSFTLAPIPAASAPYNVVIAPPAPASSTPSPAITPTVVTGVPVTAGATTALSTSPITLGSLTSTDFQSFSGTLTLQSPNVDTLVVAQEPLGTTGAVISIASQSAEESDLPDGDSAAKSETYAMMLPTAAPAVAAYSATGALSFQTSASAPTITISAYASDGESGQGDASHPTFSLGGSGDDTYSMDH